MELSEEDNGTIIAGRTGRPQLTVGAKDGLSNPQLNLANTARGGRGGGVATTTCGAMAISSPQGIKV